MKIYLCIDPEDQGHEAVKGVYLEKEKAIQKAIEFYYLDEDYEGEKLQSKASEFVQSHTVIE